MASNTPTPSKTDFRFDYTQYRSRAISVAKLDELADFVFTNNSSGIYGSIVAGLKLLCAIAYVITRKIMVDREEQIANQQYEASIDQSIRDGLNHDDLDSRPKK